MINTTVTINFRTGQKRTFKMSFFLHIHANETMLEKEKCDIHTTRGLGWKQLNLPVAGGKKQFKTILTKAYPVLKGKHFFFGTSDGRSKKISKLFGKIPDVNEFRLQV